MQAGAAMLPVARSHAATGTSIARQCRWLASAPFTTFSFTTSNWSPRRSCSQMSAAGQTQAERNMNFGLATVRRRGLMQSRNFRTWLNGPCVRVV